MASSFSFSMHAQFTVCVILCNLRGPISEMHNSLYGLEVWRYVHDSNDCVCLKKQEAYVVLSW